MKKILPFCTIALCVAFMLMSSVLYAQHDHVTHECYTTEMEQLLIQSHPEMAQEIEEAHRALEAFSRTNTNQAKGDEEHYIVPVVFHIIHNYGSENISDAQVENCIEVMNQYYNAENASLTSVNSAFQDIIGDVGIEFRLAQKDPNGECTNGIIRTASTLTYEGGNNLKVVSPIWDRSMYLNVWVCRTIESGAAGYSYLPGSVSGSWGEQNDGIVVRYNYVGNIEEGSSSRETTMPHEAGHWLDLQHLWGSANEVTHPDNCDEDDGVEDTPNTVGWNSCNPNGESCGSLDNVENLLEYSGCRKMFTAGQATHMIEALTAPIAERENLWQESNLIATGVLDQGVICHADFDVSDEPILCPGQEISFEDLSFNGVTNWEWTFEGGTPETSELENPTVVWETPGAYDVTLTVSNANGSLSITKSEFIHILPMGENTLPFEESFEDFTDLENNTENWFVGNPVDGTEKWELTDAAAYSGEKCVYVRGRYNAEGAVEFLSSPTFDLSGLTQNAVLTFKYSHARRASFSDDKLRVLISKNCGDNWSLRETLDIDELPTVSGFVTGEFVPQDQGDWVEVEIDNIASVFLNDQFRVRFEFTSVDGNNIYIDDINIVDGNPVSVSEIDFAQDITVFPNPSSDNVQLYFTMLETAQMSVSVLDISGRRLKVLFDGNQAAGEQRIQFDTSALESGVYFIRLESDGRQVSKKFLKQ